MNKESKIYVAGHRGLLGSALVRQLQRLGYRNLIFRTRQELDLREQHATHCFFDRERPEYVFLAAARVGGIKANMTEPTEFLYDNMVIAMNVIHAASKYGVTKLMNFGSSCIYPGNITKPIKESDLLTGPLEPTNEAYAIAKIAGIKLCAAMHRQYGKDFFSVMPPNLYGPGDNFDLDHCHVLPALLRKFHLGKLLMEKDFTRIAEDTAHRPLSKTYAIMKDDQESIHRLLAQFGIERDRVRLGGSGTVRREFLHVDDLADGAVRLMESVHVEDVGEFVNLGAGVDITLARLAEIVAQIVGYKGKIEFGDTVFQNGVKRKLLDSQRSRKLGIVPRRRLHSGIASTYRWYIAGGQT